MGHSWIITSGGQGCPRRPSVAVTQRVATASVRCALLHGVALLRGRPCAPRNFARGSTFNASRLPRTRCRPCACPRIYTKTEGRAFLGCTHPRRAVRVCVRSFHVVAMPPSKRKTIGKSTGVQAAHVKAARAREAADSSGASAGTERDDSMEAESCGTFASDMRFAQRPSRRPSVAVTQRVATAICKVRSAPWRCIA